MTDIKPFPDKLFRTIYIDPPWPERGGGKIKRGADRHYNLMSVAEIKALPIARLADPDGCHLYCWATNNYLPAAVECVKAWGFEYVTTITWMKDRQGLGQYYRGITEHCIFATTKKRLPYKVSPEGKRCQGKTGFYAPKTIHSRKPDEMRRMIELVSYAPRIEIFAREQFPGWDAWGNEVGELAYKNGYKVAVDDLQKEFQAITAENKRLKAERDAAVADLKWITEFFSDCTMCKHHKDRGEICDLCGVGDKSKWEWRGVKDAEE